MFGSLPTYSAYRELPNAGRIPNDWDARRFANVARLTSRIGYASERLLSVYLGRGVIPYDQGGPRVHAPSEDLSAYQLVEPGDLVLNNQQAWRGSLGVSGHHGIVSPAYLVCALDPSLSPAYAKFLFPTATMVAQLVSASRGVGDIQRGVHLPSLRNLRVPLPSLAEQQSIAKYLLHAHARIDRALAAKRKLIALLEEQRLVVTSQSVVGDNEDHPRVSGRDVDWLGKVPAHWQTKRAKYLFREYDTRSGSATEPLLSLRIHDGLVRHSEVSAVPQAAATLAHYKVVSPGSLVMNRMRAASGVFAVAREVGLVSPDYSTMTSSEEVEPEYYLELFKTRAAMAEFRRRSSGLGTGEAGFMRLQFAGFGQVILPVPPRGEQRAIVARIAKEGRTNRELSERSFREIQLLHEFRNRLTEDVVTGQVDVRGIAATLPDLPTKQALGAASGAASELDEVEFDVEVEEE